MKLLAEDNGFCLTCLRVICISMAPRIIYHLVAKEIINNIFAVKSEKYLFKAVLFYNAKVWKFCKRKQKVNL